MQLNHSSKQNGIYNANHFAQTQFEKLFYFILEKEIFIIKKSSKLNNLCGSIANFINTKLPKKSPKDFIFEKKTENATLTLRAK